MSSSRRCTGRRPPGSLNNEVSHNLRPVATDWNRVSYDRGLVLSLILRRYTRTAMRPLTYLHCGELYVNF
jgi:hypothetical protein